MPKHHLTLEFDTEAELRAYLDARADRSAPAPVETTESESDTRADAGALDTDGMAYDEAIHADPPSFTADGRWRAKRGKGEEAKAARAAFLAGGGAVTPPADLPPEPPLAAAAPEVRTETAVSGIPGMNALPPSAPEPVTVEELFAAINAKTASHPGLDVRSIYQEYAGTLDPAMLMQTLNTNETVRANIMRHLASL